MAGRSERVAMYQATQEPYMEQWDYDDRRQLPVTGVVADNPAYYGRFQFQDGMSDDSEA